MKIIQVFKLVFSLAISLLAGYIGSVFTAASIPTWYAQIKKPSFNPPNSIFGPVWTVSYILMGISAFLIWDKGITKKSKTAMGIFILQLILNILWSFFFFKMRSPLYGLIDIIILWVFILLTIINFLKISKMAGLLLIPYLLWVTFASILNYSFWRLNL